MARHEIFNSIVNDGLIGILVEDSVMNSLTDKDKETYKAVSDSCPLDLELDLLRKAYQLSSSQDKDQLLKAYKTFVKNPANVGLAEYLLR